VWTFITILGGLAVFIFGMTLMSDGFQTLAGGRFQRLLEALTSTTSDMLSVETFQSSDVPCGATRKRWRLVPGPTREEGKRG
jgi:hypothetical protein